MAPHTFIRRVALIALAGLALAAPASSARPSTDAGWMSPASVPSVSMEDLSEAEVLASRGKGAPRPVEGVAEPVADGGDSAPMFWSAGAVTALTVLLAWTLATRRRARTA